MATLTGVKIHIVVGGDGLDSNSNMYFQLYLQNRNIADYKLGNTGLQPHDVYDHVLDIHDNTLQKSEINSTVFYIEINAVGHDKIDGNLTVEFSFSDGITKSWNFGFFEVGTFHMSNSTRKQVQLDNAHEQENINPESINRLEENKVPFQFVYVLYVNGDWERRDVFADRTFIIHNGHLEGHPVHGDVKFKESIFYNNTWVDRVIQYY